MAKYENKNRKPHLGLLNFEGDTFRAYKLGISDYVIVDDQHEIIEMTNTKGIIYIMNGGKSLTTSYGRTYTIPNEHENARPSDEQLRSFLGLASLEQEEDDLEHWESVRYRMDDEGFDYCFESYSHWDEIKDEEFHRLRLEFLRTMSELRNYIEKKLRMEDKKSGMVNREGLIKESYDQYVKEGREEADRLLNQGCMVNYREFSYDDFVSVGSDPEHRWYCFFPEEYKELFNTFKDGE